MVSKEAISPKIYKLETLTRKLLKTSLITGYRRLRTNVWNIKIFLFNLIFLFLTMIRQTFLLVNTPNGNNFSSHTGFGLSRCDLWPLLKPCLECYCDYSVGGAKKLTHSPSCTKSYRYHLNQDGFFIWNMTALSVLTLVYVDIISSCDFFFSWIPTPNYGDGADDFHGSDTLIPL